MPTASRLEQRFRIELKELEMKTRSKGEQDRALKLPRRQLKSFKTTQEYRWYTEAYCGIDIPDPPLITPVRGVISATTDD